MKLWCAMSLFVFYGLAIVHLVMDKPLHSIACILIATFTIIGLLKLPLDL